ncbi:hypothetical protein HZA97_09105 [Candidatus Woesearchaeota archaeon]|nr:hypothetical protein [Candidatus Woesearchaeota archaeon]
MNFKKIDYTPIQEEVRKIWDAEGGANVPDLAEKSLDVYVDFVKSKIWPKIKIGGLVAVATTFAEVAAKNSGSGGVETFFHWVSNGACVYAGWYMGDIFGLNYGNDKTKLKEQVILPHCREYIKNKLAGK